MELFEPQTSLDKFISAGVFVIGILSNSSACVAAKKINAGYTAMLNDEFSVLKDSVTKSGLTKSIRVVLLYIPLADKNRLVAASNSETEGASMTVSQQQWQEIESLEGITLKAGCSR